MITASSGMPDQKSVMLQELFDLAEDLIRKDPNKYAFRNIQVAVLLRRTRRRHSTEFGRRISTE